MLSMILGAAIVVIGLPALLIVCVCATGNRLIRATEVSEGDCARSLAADKPAPGRHRVSRQGEPLWSAKDRRVDMLVN